MHNRSSDSRQLPQQHITIRVPWHDAGWDGTVCRDPAANTHCLVLPRVAASKKDDLERTIARRHLSMLTANELPACASERGTFMSPEAWTRTAQHPYVKSSADTHGHFDETPFEHLPYSAACVPFRWMLKSTIEGDAKDGIRGLRDELRLGYQAEREPELPFETSWVQDRDNQLAVLDTFYSAVVPQSSLCFFYAKRTPMVDDPRRVLVGVGRVLRVAQAVEYRYKKAAKGAQSIRCMLWERNVVHSIRPDFVDGFLLPYREILALAEQDASLNAADLTVFAPEEYRAQFSYGCELLPHDGAIAALVACATGLKRIKDTVPGSWDGAIAWIDRELNRLWKARGAFPGLGSALRAFGLENGNLIAYAIASAQADAKREWTEDPWELVDAVFDDPALLPGGAADDLGPAWKQRWKKLPVERRALLKLLSRFALSDEQATRFYIAEEREKAGIKVTDTELLANPYRLYELDRRAVDAAAFGFIDRGVFPDPQLRKAFPLPVPSRVTESIDARRVRALVIDTLEGATNEGHTLLPNTWLVQRVRSRPLDPPCPMDSDLLATTADTFAPLVASTTLANGLPALQLDRHTETCEIIRRAVKLRLKAPRHAARYNWAQKVAEGLPPLSAADNGASDETRARAEKAAAIEELFSSRFSVLIGAAGTGKTTLLKMLCNLPEVDQAGVLLLAPTGKARVRLEQQTERRGQGQTLAQFLLRWQRYDGRTGRYFPNASGGKYGGARTIIVDECSMLTEEQLAALFDVLGPVDRVVLVGDPRQLPPIGAGRPFVDIVRELAPEHVETLTLRCAKGYAELTIPVRQRGSSRDDRLLAAHFGGKPLDAGADEIWTQIAGGHSDTVRVVQWRDAAELHEKLIAEIATELDLGAPPSEALFEQSCGGTVFDKNGQVYFWPGRDGNVGAAGAVDRWQVLGAVRGMQHGVDAVNREIQKRFRTRARQMATPEKFYMRKIPKPLGPQGLLWGDKVINVRNNGRRKAWPKQDGAYIANGDMGVVVGEYKTEKKGKLPKHLEVEFNAFPGVRFTYWNGEFSGDDASPEIELAYALTVHKTQGSEFGVTFVVIPNPCRLLSRELLYTALTRHQKCVVVLHQGPIAELRRYSAESASELAQRMTNLFKDANPREVAVGKERRFLEDRLIHRSERGDLMRSKSEVLIADKLYTRGVAYAYEAPLPFSDGVDRYPDFSFAHEITGVNYYWEHLGMLDDEVYRARWERKLAAYRKSEILPREEGGGLRGTLIITRDEPGGGFDSAKIAKLIDEVLEGE